MTILHICPLDKFIPPFIAFVRKHLGTEGQLFFTYGNIEQYPYASGTDAIHLPGTKNRVNKIYRYFLMFYRMYKSERIILHGLFDNLVITGLFFQPWLLKKCFWLVWGGDLYHQGLDNKSFWPPKLFIRKYVIRNMGHIVTSIDGDYENIKAWCKAKGQRLDAYTYPSSLYIPVVGVPKKDGITRILLGNSANPSNNHEDALNKLLKFKEKNIQIYCPLSYGEKPYAEKIIKLGINLFGDKFIPMTEFMTIDEYNKFLFDIDIVFFNHDRQQGMSTVRVALGMGKKVFMRDDVTPFKLFKKHGIKVFSTSDAHIDVDFESKEKNMELIKRLYSEAALIKNLKLLFHSEI